MPLLKPYLLRHIVLFFGMLVSVYAHAQISANKTEGCAPLASVVFSHNFGNVSNLLWNFGDGVTSGLNNPTHTYQDPGSYTVTFTADGGINSSLVITVYPNPVANFGIVGANAGEAPLTVEFLDQSTAAAGSTFESWEWDFGDGSVLISDNDNPSHTYTLLGVFPVSLLVTDNRGCSNFYGLNDAVKTCTPPDVVLTNSPLSACFPPLEVTFSVSASSNSPNGDELAYYWDLGSGIEDFTPNPPPLNYSADGTYPISFSVTDNLGCSYERNLEVFIGNPVAEWELLGGPNFCETVTFSNNSDPISTTVIWKPGDVEDFEFPPDTFSHFFFEPGEYSPIIIVSSDGCSDSDTLTFTTTEAIALFNSGPNIGCAPELTVGYLGMTPNAAAYEWNFSGSLAFGQYVQHTYTVPVIEDPYNQTTLYVFNTDLKVTTNFGCVAYLTESANDTIVNPFAGFGVDKSDGCAPLEIMFSDSSHSDNEIINWYWNMGDGTVIQVQDSADAPSYTYSEPGDFNSFVVVETAIGCLDTSYIIPIKVGGPIEMAIGISPTQACPGELIEFQAVPQFGSIIDLVSFQSDNGMLSGCPSLSGIESGFFSEAGFHDLTVMASYNGCITTQTLSNAVEILGPIGHFKSTIDCETPFTVNCSGNITGATEWTYDFGDGNSITGTNQDVSHTYDATGDYTITLTSVASTGCDPYVETFEVHIRDIHAALAIEEDQICRNSSLSLSSLGSKDVQAYCNEGYLWLFDKALQLVPYRTDYGNIDVLIKKSGVFTMSLVVEDINGCRDTASADITVFGVDVNIDTTLIGPCVPFEIDFEAIVVSDLEIESYLWDFGDGSANSADSAPNHAFNPSSSLPYEVIVLVTDTFGCQDSSRIFVGPDLPDPDFSVSEIESCEEDFVIFSAVNLNYLHYQWDFGDGQTGEDSITQHVYNSNGSFDVQLVVTSQKGCVDSLLIPDIITVQPSPDVGYVTNIEEGEPLCFPITIQFTDTTSDLNFDYRIWDLGTGEGVVPDQSVGRTYEFPDIYTVTLEVFTTNGCSGFYQQDFKVEGPVGDFLLNNPAICSYDSITLQIVDSVDVANFSWDLGNGVDTANISPLVYQYPDIQSTENVFIQLILWSKDSTCTSITDHNLIINHTVADFDRNAESIVMDSIHCFGIPDVFNNQSSVDASVFYWDFGDGGNSTQESPTYTYPLGGEYTVTLEAKNSGLGCVDTIRKTMFIFPEFVAEASAQMVCSFDTLYLEASGGVGYLWSPQNAVSDPTIPNPYLLVNENQTLEVQVTDENDCSQIVAVEARFVVEPPQPAWTDTSISLGNSLNFNYPLEDYHNFFWIDENGDNCFDCGMEFVPGATGDYFLVISDDLGCFVDTIKYHVTLLHEVEVESPNIFSPNNDGINDTFKFDIERASESGYEFSIFNRWGKLIWTTNNLDQGWDGTSNQAGSDKKVSEGVYFWTVNISNLIGEQRTYKGYITLVR